MIRLARSMSLRTRFDYRATSCQAPEKGEIIDERIPDVVTARADALLGLGTRGRCARPRRGKNGSRLGGTFWNRSHRGTAARGVGCNTSKTAHRPARQIVGPDFDDALRPARPRPRQVF